MKIFAVDTAYRNLSIRKQWTMQEISILIRPQDINEGTIKPFDRIYTAKAKKAYDFIDRKPFISLAEGPGFEPGLTGPEPVVLPLDDPSVVYRIGNYNIYPNASRKFCLIVMIDRFV